MKTLLGIEITDEQFDSLFCEQAKGKELKVINGEVVAVEHETTQEEINEHRKYEIKKRLSSLTEDLAQVQAGLVVDDIESKKEEFRTLLNEIRVLEGKAPREIN